MSAQHPLQNTFWHSLTAAQAHFAVGTGSARRYAPGFSPVLGFEEPDAPDFDALRPYCKPDEQFYVAGWTGPAPDGWSIEAESTMFCMVWDGCAIAPETEAGTDILGPADAAAAIDLASLTRPGPFGPRTVELGSYFGLREGGRLVAMAGERAHVGEFREVSGVCTHPDVQGRGLAGRLTRLVVARQLSRHQVPFLHVMSANTVARDFYRRMGFVDLHEIAVRIVKPVWA
jgi:ribosomal protein S18 acetylase RimI-like enzyme